MYLKIPSYLIKEDIPNMLRYLSNNNQEITDSLDKINRYNLKNILQKDNDFLDSSDMVFNEVLWSFYYFLSKLQDPKSYFKDKWPRCRLVYTDKYFKPLKDIGNDLDKKTKP